MDKLQQDFELWAKDHSRQFDLDKFSAVSGCEGYYFLTTRAVWELWQDRW